MKTLVIGGGMAGLTYGIVSAKNGIDTTICERNNRVGKKLSQTGNGKCNIGNANVSADCFNSCKVAQTVTSAVPVDTYLRFLRSCGIVTFADPNGRLYPLSESASNVVDCLRFQFAKCGGKLLVDTPVTSIKPLKCGFAVNLGGDEQVFDKVIVACGSGSGAPSVDAKSLLGNVLTPLVPSLVPVKVCAIERQLNGLRAKANVTLLCDGQPLATQSGEVQFKDYGLSGICIFNLSALIARSLVRGEKHNYVFSVDLVPGLSQAELEALLASRMDDPVDTLFFGILHNKLAQCVVARSKLTAAALARTAKNFTFDFAKLLDFSMSQATAGGVDEKYLDLTNLSLPNGVVAIGEVLNVDGLCGGNNLYFAAASALYLFSPNMLQKAFE